MSLSGIPFSNCKLRRRKNVEEATLNLCSDLCSMLEHNKETVGPWWGVGSWRWWRLNVCCLPCCGLCFTTKGRVLKVSQKTIIQRLMNCGGLQWTKLAQTNGDVADVCRTGIRWKCLFLAQLSDEFVFGYFSYDFKYQLGDKILSKGRKMHLLAQWRSCCGSQAKCSP